MQKSLIGRHVVAVHYFIYFGVMGLYLPFFNLYCFKIGFSGWQIGTLSATRSMVLIVFSIVWSLLADRHQVRRPIYILCNLTSAMLWALFLLSTDFYWILVFTALYGIFYAPIIAFLETFAVESLGGEKKRYGGMRAWGSLAFILVVLVMGRVIDRHGVTIILGLILAGSWIQALVSFGFPRAVTTGGGPSGRSWRSLLKPQLVIFWICAFLMLLSHGAYYAFFSIHLAQLGFGAGFIGLCWALASAAEISVMLNSERLFRRFSYETVLLTSLFVAALRWTGMWTAESIWTVLVLQLSHFITYGAFHMASILYTDHWATKENKTLAQAVNNAVTYGLGLMAGFFLSGVIYESMGAGAMFASSALFALAGGVIFSCFVGYKRRFGAF